MSWYHEEQNKPLQDLGDFFEEIRPLNLFDSRAPLDVVREEMGQDCLRNWNTQTTKE